MSERTQIAVQAVVVLIVFAAAIAGIVASVGAAPPPIAPSSSGPDASPLATTVRSPSPSPANTAPTAAATPSPTPTASRQPIATRSYAFGGRAYTGVDLGPGWTIVAPFDGRAEIHVYQLIDGVIREFTDVAGVPSYPYVIVTAPDGRKATYRPGALSTDTRLVVRASQVKEGDELFTVIGGGPSSWHDFYDASISFRIVVSLVTAVGADADAAPLVKGR